MTVYEFGRAKLAAKDIDPLYNALAASGWSREKKCRFTLAFVAFDLAGLAGMITDAGPKRFWEAMLGAVALKPRGQPRRYYRGDAALASIVALSERYGTAQKALDDLAGRYAEAYQVICSYWHGWGPTAAWKLADMAERCCGVPIDFNDFTPTQLISNDMIRKGCRKQTASDDPYDHGRLIIRMLDYDWRATPPGDPTERRVGPQELETILCYYSHDDAKSKHLVGMDRQNIIRELNQFPTSKSAMELKGLFDDGIC